MINPYSEPMTQAVVEQATGLSRDLLRKWETRYQFPTPTRDARGRRQYSAQDVQKLTLIKPLIRQGMRPVDVVALPLQVLQEMLDASTTASASDDAPAPTQRLLACLAPGSATTAVHTFIDKMIRRDGLACFADRHLPVFNQAVGDAWASGQLAVHAEHHYTEAVRFAVVHALTMLKLPQIPPGVLLTTPPGEQHGLGLLALQVALVMQCAECVNLGTQTPVSEVVAAAAQWGSDVVAISVSSAASTAATQAYIAALRGVLPAQCALWVGGAGGQCVADLRIPGVQVFGTTAQAVTAWKQLSQQMRTASTSVGQMR